MVDGLARFFETRNWLSRCFMANDVIIGIDLGTTNSEVAAMVGDRVRLLGPVDLCMLPSCVGLSTSGELLVGAPARNQQLMYPERTVRSIKRQMGSMETVALGDRHFTPPEISAVAPSTSPS
jgi:molecular chaperone DnaK (HSP70)